jgi:CRISPR-associated endonuclease Csn1
METNVPSVKNYVLGLDIGSTSVGWACVELRRGKPTEIIASGVRRFDPGMAGGPIDFEKGKEQSKAVDRRRARLARRQIRRRSVRRWRVFQILQQAGLLPQEKVNGRRDLSEFIVKLDRGLSERYIASKDHVSAQLLVYKVRAQAAQQRVELFALGRAFLHFAKRRGFNSNLRGTPKEDDESGQVKPAINSLAAELNSTNKTLGQYLASVNPFGPRRVRKRWTGREMFMQEFDRIWNTQAAFYPELTDSLYKKLRKSIFFQRPLRSAKGLVGKCTLEPRKRRLAAAHPLAQEVRMLQFVNNVRVQKKGHLDRQLTEDERSIAIAALSECKSLKMKDFRGLLNLPKGSKINFEGDDDTHAVGMGTVSEIRSIIGDKWEALTNDDKERLVYEILSFNKRDALIRRGQSFWGFNQHQAEMLAELTLEPGYASHSKLALTRLLEYLKTKDSESNRYLTYAEAKLKAYPDSQVSNAIYDRLPPVREHLQNVTNPAIIRALTEVRKVVNELILRFGKPEMIRIELARELKKSKKERKRIEDMIREQTKKRSSALARIREEFMSYPDKRGYDRGVEMVMLAEECNWACPYTGTVISNVRDLIGDNTRFDIEHIYPRRYLDDSFSNKTICFHEENRHVKRDRLPAIAYSDNPERYAKILDRVKAFKGPAAQKKLIRFMAREVPPDFASRQLNETRYASVAAADYLALLFGGRIDSDGRQRVATLTGSLTAILRGQWRLNQILGYNGEKNRADHRQHAIDAIVVASTSMGVVATLQKAAELAWQQGNNRTFPQIDPPWPTFFDASRESVLAVIVSHRQHKRVNGPLHADSNYSITQDKKTGKILSKIRKPLEGLSEKEISGDSIVDLTIRQLVQAKYNHLKVIHGASKKPKDVFSHLESHPFIRNRDGSTTAIHSVRVWAQMKPEPIRKNDPTRYVDSTAGSNFCIRIVPIFDLSGREIGWTDELVSRKEVMANVGCKSDQNNSGFDLFIHEHVAMADAEGNIGVYRVMNVSKGDIEVRLHHDGRSSDEVKKAKQRIRIGAGAMKRRCFRKVSVSPTGQLKDPLTGLIVDLENLEIGKRSNQTTEGDVEKGK